VKHVVIVGSGVGGTAAALAASLAGARVTMIAGGTGASVLATGALDENAWDSESDGAAPAAQLDARAREVLGALDAYVLPPRGVLLATMSGVVRPARGADRALLDLSALPASGVIAVPCFDHATWDGATLARAWADAGHARERGLTFAALSTQLTRHTDERMAPDADLASRHDDSGRLAWLATQLGDALARLDARPAAVLLPPWLGVERARGAALSQRVGTLCGEALGAPGGPSGLRFERARDRALDAAQVEVVQGRARRVERAGDGLCIDLETREEIAADAIVIATGGLVGGGLAYTPGGAVLAAAIPPSARPLVSLTIDAPLALGAYGRPLDLPGSLFGAAPEAHAWPFASDPMLDHAGVLADETGHVAAAPEGLFAAGELLADRPRTWLAALASGVRAGTAAARA
jgi:glycerol-3-phosphate dehydrogenase subunit B